MIKLFPFVTKKCAHLLFFSAAQALDQDFVARSEQGEDKKQYWKASVGMWQGHHQDVIQAELGWP